MSPSRLREGEGRGSKAVKKISLTVFLLLFTLGSALSAADSATVSFIGDCSLGDAYPYHAYGEVIEREGDDWSFSLVQEWLAADDLTVANLEVVLTENTKHKDKMYALRGKPDYAAVLTAGSVEVVNTVNNHCEDFYRSGYLDTLAALDAEGVDRFGCNNPDGNNGVDDLLVREVNGIRFGFIGFSYPQTADVQRIEKRVKLLKEERGCDLVVVSLHWGREEHDTPTTGQLDYAKRVLDAGADMIYGHHPHVLQQICFYQGKPILFSTGNFTFGTMSRVDPATGIFQLTWEKTEAGVALRKLEVIPCQTTLGPDYRPFPLEDQEARESVWAKLRFSDKTWAKWTKAQKYADFTTLPETFLTTGVVYLDEENADESAPAENETRK